MIVECSQCHAKFRLDDAKLNERGVKVRCSKCQHIFTVKSTPPSAPEPDKTMIAMDPLPPPPPPKPQAPPPPPAKPKAPPPPPKAAEPDFMPPSPPKKAADDSLDSFDFKEDSETPKESAGFDDGLGDLSFSDEASPPAPSAPDTPTDSDFGDFSKPEEKSPGDSGVEQDDFGDFDFDDDISSESETGAPAASQPPPKSASDDLLGDIPDFSSSEPEPPPPSAASSGAPDMGTDDFGAGDFNLGTDTTPPPPAKPGAPGGEGIEEFGDISFDDAGMRESTAAPAGGPKSPTPPPPDVAGLELDRGVGGSAAEGFKQGAEDSYAFDASASELPDVEVPSRPAARQEMHEQLAPPPATAPRPGGARREVAPPRGKKGSKKIVAILLVIGIIGGGFFFLSSTGKLDEIKKIPLKELNLDKIKELIGLKKKVVPRDVWEFNPTVQRFYSVERAGGAKLWVLRGNITNRFTKGMRAILLEGQIMDGEILKTAQAMVGPLVTDEKLRTLPLEKIHEDLMSTLDEKLEPRVLLTDDKMDFVIVFEGVVSAKPTLMDPPVQVVKSDSL